MSGASSNQFSDSESIVTNTSMFDEDVILNSSYEQVEHLINEYIEDDLLNKSYDENAQAIENLQTKSILDELDDTSYDSVLILINENDIHQRTSVQPAPITKTPSLSSVPAHIHYKTNILTQPEINASAPAIRKSTSNINAYEQNKQILSEFYRKMVLDSIEVRLMKRPALQFECSDFFYPFSEWPSLILHFMCDRKDLEYLLLFSMGTDYHLRNVHLLSNCSSTSADHTSVLMNGRDVCMNLKPCIVGWTTQVTPHLHHTVYARSTSIIA